MKKSNLIVTIIGLFSPMIVLAAELNTPPNDIVVSNVHIRSLAASCAACHGTNGNHAGSRLSEGPVTLAGIAKADFLSKMLAFKFGERAVTVMHHHAKGLTSQEIVNLAEYFSAQVARPPISLPSQKLLADHAN